MNQLARVIYAAALFSAVSSVGWGQTYYYPAPPVAAPAPVVLLGSDQLDQLLAPIALYPDPLIAQILPAATYPLDLVTANQWAHANANAPDQVIDAQPWEESIKALIHYPTVLDQLAGNLGWTQQLGTAYLNQPADVMNSIQRLRGQAESAGTLISTPQQQVIVESGITYIIPADPEVIYVPTYDPAICYQRREPLRFSVGFHIGNWLNLDADWHNHYVVTGVHWDRNHWEHFHDLPQHHEEHHDKAPAHREQPPQRVPWTRNPDRPLVVPQPHAEPEHRFYPAPSTPVEPRVFGGDHPRVEVEHEENRGRQSLHQPQHNEPAPHPTPAPRPEPAHHEEPAHPTPPGMQPHPAQPAAHDQPHDRDGRH